MWNKKDFEERMKKENIKIRFWGRHGKAAADDLEKQLNFKFNPEVRSFIEEIGNVQFCGNSILIAGDEEGTYNCISESEDIGLLKEGQSPEGVKILDNAGLSFILYKDGSIKAYEHAYLESDGIVFSYNSFSDLIDSLIKQAHESE